MRVRAQDANGDMTFGHSLANYLVDSPAAVAQSVLTRLRLLRGEWFLDKTAGTPWATQVLGKGTRPLYDLAIQQRILATNGVTGYSNYSSSLDPGTRALTVNVTISTRYGVAPVSTSLSVPR